MGQTAIHGRAAAGAIQPAADARLQRLLQICTASVAVLSTLMLGIGEQKLTLPALTLVAAAAAFYLTDVKGWIRLDTRWSNVASLLALGMAAWQWQSLSSENRVLALADLLIYLQLVLLFREKTVRNYWLLTLVALLQVAVAAALNLDMVFGLLLVGYLVLAVLMLGLFLLWREQQWSGAALDNDELAVGEPPRRWPLAAQASYFLPPEPAGAGAPLGGLARQMLRVCFWSLLLAVGFFMVVPRLPHATWRPAAASVVHVAGYADEVDLNTAAEIVEDTTVAMQLKLFDAKTGEPYRLAEEPRLRGTSLSRYENGRWQQGPGLRQIDPLRPQPRRLDGLIRQQVTIEAIETETLFCIYSPIAWNEETGLTIFHRPQLGQVFRTKSSQPRRATYELLTDGIRDNYIRDVIPQTRPLYQTRHLVELPETAEGESRLPGLVELAEELVADIPPQNRVARARRLESYLRDSGLFEYSLSSVPDASRDPIEDFVMHRRQGHCELFAGGLALMLRSVGIPARVVIGYRGGTWNNVGHFYHIEQLHAHAWVEAFLEPAHLEVASLQEEVAELGPMPFGGWLQLDATPGSSGEGELAHGYGWYFYYQARDYCQFIWSNYVLGMDAGLQQQTIYAPLREALRQMARLTSGEGDTAAALRRVMTAVTQPSSWRSVRWQDWFSWRGALAAAAIALVGGLGGRWLLRTARAAYKRWTSGRSCGGQKRHVEFYERLERLLARHALVRLAAQTPREFALVIGGQLSEDPTTRPAAGLARQIVDQFYRVRFGGATLDSDEAEAVEHALASLGEALGRRAHSATRG